MKHAICSGCWLWLLVTLAAAQPSPTFPPPKNLGEPATLGRNIQRTMTLLATSTPEHRNTVKILFYGQSITEQEWWKEVAGDLRRRFPHANLIIENRAIGGHSSQLLVKTAEADLYPFYPDLMIFYVYGSHLDYESIIRRTRECTTAEILMQTDHSTRDEDLTEETDQAKLTPKQWSSWMNYSFLPNTAKKYQCGLVDQHNLWKQYLKDYSLPANQLLKDGVHLNVQGNFVMAEMVKAQLVHRAEATSDPMNCDAVKTYRVGQDVAWKDGKLTLAFEGNRVDVIATDAKLTLRIDGKKPSQFPELYACTRVGAFPNSNWPLLLRVGSEKPLQLEEWTLTVKDAAPGQKQFHFEVAGSKTGPDGEGTSYQKFVSRSGRVVIEPSDWNLEYCFKVFKRPLPANFKAKWRIVPQFHDEIMPGRTGTPTPGTEPAVTVAQGLPNGQHTLELTGDGENIRAIRIYRPSLK